MIIIFKNILNPVFVKKDISCHVIKIPNALTAVKNKISFL